LSNPVSPGQSFSVVNGFGFGPVTLAGGSMGAGYGGTGTSLTYQESATFTQGGGFFLIDLLSSSSLGTGFDTALFEISVNGSVVDTQLFRDLTSAEAFFSNDLINVPLPDGPNVIQVLFNETMSNSQGFAFNYGLSSFNNGSPTPLPPAFSLFATGLGALGLLGRRRKWKVGSALSALIDRSAWR
jgi:hypothetical protein